MHIHVCQFYLPADQFFINCGHRSVCQYVHDIKKCYKVKGVVSKCLNDSFNLNFVGNLKRGPSFLCNLKHNALALQLKTVDACNF